MRSSAVLATCFGALALAKPIRHIHDHEKKAVVWDVVTDLVVVTITAGAEPTHTSHSHHSPKVVVVSKTVWVQPTEAAPTSTSTPLPAPTTSSTSEAPVVVVTTVEAAPVAATTEAPVAVPSTTQAPVVVVTVEPTTEAPAATTSAVVVQAVPATTAAAVAAASVVTAWEPTNSIALQIASDVDASVNNHGTARSAHSAVTMAWNQSLADSAAVLAGSCVWGHDMTINGGGYGQNLAAQGSSSSDAWTPATALENAIISEWYSEESMFASQNLYGQNSPAGSGDYLHFTQVVWKGSETMGCAVAKCGTSNTLFSGMYMWYTVCNYYPAGNVEGYFAANVASS